MNDYQFIRYQRIYMENYYLLDWIIREKEIFFAIAGSTYNIYNVIINKNNKSISCSCRDFIDNCLEKNIVCKHCCFILFIVLRLFRKYNPKINILRLNRPNGYNIYNDSDFFKNLIFTNVELLIIEKKIKLLNSKSNSFINKSLIDKYRYIMLLQEQKKILYQKFIREKLPSDKDVICGICIKIITNNDNLIYLSCPDCKKFVHQNCMKKWLEKKENCVYCRSEIWKTYTELENNKQINLLENII